MSFRHLRRNLQKAINSEDVKTVKKIVEKYTKLPSIHPERCNLWRLLDSIWRFSIYCKNDEISEILIEFLNEFFRLADQSKLKKLLILAVQNGNLKVTDLLLRKGAKAEGPQWQDVSLVAQRVFDRKNIHSRKEILSLLLRYDMNVSMSNKDNQNLLHEFVYNYAEENDLDAVDIAEDLIVYGASVHDVDCHGRTPLTYSVMKDIYKLVRLIIRYTDYLNEKDDILVVDYYLPNLPVNHVAGDKGWTTLHAACRFNKKFAINLLLHKRADVNILNSEKKTPFSMLRPELKNYEACVQLMVKEFAKLRFQNLPVSETDMDAVNADEKTREYFEECLSELKKMASFKFYGPYTYFFVLKKFNDLKRLANLAKNKGFVANLKKNINLFNFYNDNLQGIFFEVLEIRDESLIIENKLNDIFGQILPAVVLRRLEHYITVKDLP